MMSKPKSRLINSASVLAFLLALSFAFGASQACAKDPEAMSSPPRMVLDTTGEVAEWWICYSYSKRRSNLHQHTPGGRSVEP
jgi:hypothetical protein